MEITTDDHFLDDNKKVDNGFFVRSRKRSKEK